MISRTTFAMLVILGLTWCSASVLGQEPVFHDALLNWDFENYTTQDADDFEIIVSNPDYDPDPTDPNQVYTGPIGFPEATVIRGDFDPVNPGNETMIRWFGRLFNPDPDGPGPLRGDVAHIGLNMQDAGTILGARWTINNDPIPWAAPITFELTRVTASNSADIDMLLNIPASFFADDNHPDFPDQQAGWTNIRTFSNIPADELDLVDLNEGLDLDALAQYATTPIDRATNDEIEPSDEFLMSDDSVFEIFVDNVEDQFANRNFESLLVAEVLNQGTVIGRFWNLNPQSPEPGASILLVVGAILLAAMTRRSACSDSVELRI